MADMPPTPTFIAHRGHLHTAGIIGFVANSVGLHSPVHFDPDYSHLHPFGKADAAGLPLAIVVVLTTPRHWLPVPVPA